MAGTTHRLHQTPSASCSVSCCGITYTANRSNVPSYHHLFDLILIGVTGVGKSSLISQFTEDTYTDNYLTTIGLDFKDKTVKLDEETVKLEVWDMAGGERNRTLLRRYFRGAHGIVFVYDVTNQASFDQCRDWLVRIDPPNKHDLSMILVGNKCDKITDKVVDYSTAKEFADQCGVPFMETSAKDGKNVEQAFILLTAMVKNRCSKMS